MREGNRLTSESITSDPSKNNGSVSYGLDPVGNRTSASSSLNAVPSGNWSFNADELPGGNEFFRGLFGDQPFAMLNNLGGAPFAQVGVHLVSP